MVSIFDPSATGEVANDGMDVDRDDICSFGESISLLAYIFMGIIILSMQ